MSLSMLGTASQKLRSKMNSKLCKKIQPGNINIKIPVPVKSRTGIRNVVHQQKLVMIYPSKLPGSQEQSPVQQKEYLSAE